MASITSYPPDQYGRKRWRVRIKHNSVHAISKVITGDKLDAQKWAIDQELLLRGGRYESALAASQMNLGAALNKYLATVSRKKKSHKDDVSRGRLFLQRHPELAALPLDRVRPVDFDTMREVMMEDLGLKGATYNRYLNLIGAIYTAAKKYWRIDGLDNPTHGMDEPEVSRDRRPSQDELDKLWPALAEVGRRRNVPLREITELALYSGMRQGELVALRVEDVRLEYMYLTVRSQNSKTGKLRQVRLSEKAADVIRQMPARAAGPMFTNFKAGSHVAALFCLARKEAGLDEGFEKPSDRVRFHDLRREFSSRMAEVGFSPLAIMALTGHLTLDSLLVYSHVNQEAVVSDPRWEKFGDL